MAKLKRPLNSEKARGALGGIVFSESNQVNYARKNTVRPYVKTEKRKEAANRLSLSAAGWQRMTEADKQHWVDFAESTAAWNAFGERFTKPAFSWYCACRENLASVGHPKNPKILDAEFPPTPYQISYQQPSIFDSRLIIIGSQTEAPGQYYLRLYKSKIPSSSRLFNISECELWKADNTVNNQCRFNMTTQEYNAFKGVYTIFAQFVDRDSGLASDFFKARIDFE